ncbi:rhoptry protein [Cryptosporidium felis]|nr:rhoptry protein [Cryptosporidium felis]
MYPQSPRNRFDSNESFTAVPSNMTSRISYAYPNSSNESLSFIKNESGKIYANAGQSNIPVIGGSTIHRGKEDSDHRTVLKTLHTYSQDTDPIYKDEEHINNRFIIPNSTLEENNMNTNQITNKLYNIISETQEELKQVKQQYNILKIKEINLSKNYELSLAKQNELKTTIVGLENLVNQLRNRKIHEASIITNQLKLKNHDHSIFATLGTFFKAVFEFREIIKRLPIEGGTSIEKEINRIESIINTFMSQEEFDREIKFIKEEREQLISLIGDLASSTACYINQNTNENELRNETIKQINISLFDQIQILEFKLKRSAELHKKNISKIINFIESTVQSENISNQTIKEIKSYINSRCTGEI